MSFLYNSRLPDPGNSPERPQRLPGNYLNTQGKALWQSLPPQSGTPFAICFDQEQENPKEVDDMTTMANTMAAGQAVAAVHSGVETRERENVAKNIALFFAAPFIGLGYIIAFPFIGFAVLLKALLRG
jgi:hypothetical protein